MCLAVPARVEAMDSAADTAVVVLGGVKKEVSLALVEDVRPGDYLLIHVGYALNRISPEEAERTLKLIGEAGLEAQPQ
jgi:hydrogenase expression/formation protein HypC